MDDSMSRFRKREQALRRKHIRMAQGYVTRMNNNGLIEQVPDNKAGGIALRVVWRVVLALMIFKVGVLVWLGDATYLDHVDALSRGALHERAGAWLMQIDPVSGFLADLVAQLIG